jgi:hypothetical protein
MHRRRKDTLGRFLPTIPFLDNNPELACNLFEEEGGQEINPFIDNLFAELPFEDLEENLFALILHQAPMAHNPPNRPPTFQFPIIAQQENDNLKNTPSSLLPKFYGLVLEDP